MPAEQSVTASSKSCAWANVQAEYSKKAVSHAAGAEPNQLLDLQICIAGFVMAFAGEPDGNNAVAGLTTLPGLCAALLAVCEGNRLYVMALSLSFGAA